MPKSAPLKAPLNKAATPAKPAVKRAVSAPVDPLLPFFAPTRFTRSVSQLNQLSEPDLPEVAFVGRSNVGKSSAINALVNQRQLAISSKTPGRTRLINYFEVPTPGTQIERTKRGVDLSPEQSGVLKPPPVGFLVDLPGYGFAKISERERQAWDQLIGGYIEKRDCLNGVVILVDARHGVKPLDESMLVWALEAGRDVLVVANKSDKLTQSELSRSLREISAFLEPYQRHYQTPIAHCPFSSQSQKGAAAIRLWIAERLGYANTEG